MSTPVAVAISVGFLGAVATPFLAARGLRHLEWTGALRRWFRPLLAVAGGAAGVAIALLSSRAGDWALLPALLAWSWPLVALAGCDVLTQRIPTALVRQSTVVVCLLLICGGAIGGPWRFVVGAVGCSMAAGAVMLLARRFAGAGAGDVRLAVLGGLGLTSANAISLLAGLGVWAAVVAGQTAVSIVQGGSARTHIALGPGMVAGFLVAAVIPA